MSVERGGGDGGGKEMKVFMDGRFMKGSSVQFSASARTFTDERSL